MKKFFSLFALVLAVLFLASCSAQAQYAKQGTLELGGAASYSSTTTVNNGTKDTEATTLLQFTPFVSYFFMDSFSVGIVPSISILNPAHATDNIKFYGLFAAPGYTFNMNSNVFPFIEGLVGYTSISSGGNSNSGLSYGGKGGIKLMVGQNGLASFGFSYMIIDVSPSGSTGRTGFNNFAFSVGYSVFIN